MSRPTRRDLFKTGAGAAVAGLIGAKTSGAGEARSRAVMIRSANVVAEDGLLDGPQLHQMMNQAVAKLLGEDDAASAWKKLVKPTDVVGVKTNVWSNIRTPPELEEAIREEVVKAGVAPADVGVDDRGVRGNELFKRATAIVNVRPMRTHHWSGLGTCLKNMIMFVPRPADYHGDTCATLGAIWKLPELEGKVRLNILVMLTPQFHGVGPHSFSRRFVWTYGGLIVGTEPAPVDAVGAAIIQAKRDEYFGEPTPIAPSPHHIQLADERYGLGAAKLDRIDLIRLGWQDDALI